MPYFILSFHGLLCSLVSPTCPIQGGLAEKVPNTDFLDSFLGSLG